MKQKQLVKLLSELSDDDAEVVDIKITPETLRVTSISTTGEEVEHVKLLK